MGSNKTTTTTDTAVPRTTKAKVVEGSSELTAAPMPSELTWAEIKARKKAPTKTIPIQLDGAIAAQIETLREEIQKAKLLDSRAASPDMGSSSRATALTRELFDLLDSAAESEVDFTFKGIGNTAFNDLLKKHRPTQTQIKDIRRELGNNKANLDYNPDTFPPVLISASLVSPAMTLEEAQDMFEDPEWNLAELTKMFRAALEVNNEVPDIPFTRDAYARILGSV